MPKVGLNTCPTVWAARPLEPLLESTHERVVLLGAPGRYRARLGRIPPGGSRTR